MNWFRKIWRKRLPYDEEFSQNLYDALVLEGGPGSDTEDHLDAIKLNIRIGDLERFSEKRLIMLEAFCFVAVQMATTSSSEKLLQIFETIDPLAIEMGKLIQKKWAERGIVFDSHFDVGERNFAEIDLFLEKPFKWGREWLNEFYEDNDESGNHYIMWTVQCLKQFKAMKMVVDSHR